MIRTQDHGPGLRPRHSIRLFLATCTALLLALSLGLALPRVATAKVGKGIIDMALEAQAPGSAATPGMVHEIDRGLSARWIRLHVGWSALEAERGTYDPTELRRLDGLVDQLHRAGVKIILDVLATPAWAQESSLWRNPPAGESPGPHAFYPVRRGALADFGALGHFLALRYAGRVQALECWNEPNLWMFLYPQRTPSDPYFGARSYLRMLRAFQAGVRRAGVRMQVVAGATAPVGLNDSYRTSPQRFAAFLRRSGAAKLFDVYSHHPYTPGGSIYRAPGQPPNDPSNTVTLYNLRVLLRLFPHKPFYLTEYGYSTQPSDAFGGFSVSEAEQSRYLKQAYALAGRYPQVKMLAWFLLRDQRPTDGPGTGVYSGLRRANGSRKPAWYTFREL
jgi:hypothetical protein